MNRIIKIAAAILIVVGVGAVIGLLTQGKAMASVAWADVQEKIRSIRAIKYIVTEYVLTEDGQEQHVEIRKVIEDGFGRTRTESSQRAREIVIQDMQSGKVLVLDTTSKNATLYEYVRSGQPHYPSFKDRLKEMIDEGHIELGEKVMNEARAKGYRVKVAYPSGDYVIDIWVNAKTAEPIITQSVRTMGHKKFKSVHTNFDFNVHVDKSLFSTISPEGYFLKKETIQPFTPTVDDVVFVLRNCSERNNGNFPDSFRLGDLMKGIPEKEFNKIFLKSEALNRLNGAIYLQTLSSARYLGKGVRFGDAETAIFWYKPKGSEMYKVIYGDLSIKEVGEGDLPR